MGDLRIISSQSIQPVDKDSQQLGSILAFVVMSLRTSNGRSRSRRGWVIVDP